MQTPFNAGEACVNTAGHTGAWSEALEEKELKFTLPILDKRQRRGSWEGPETNAPRFLHFTC